MTTEDAIAFFGSRQLMADALNINLYATYKPSWNPEPPILRQYEIERITKGKLKVSKG